MFWLQASNECVAVQQHQASNYINPSQCITQCRALVAPLCIFRTLICCQTDAQTLNADFGRASSIGLQPTKRISDHWSEDPHKAPPPHPRACFPIMAPPTLTGTPTLDLPPDCASQNPTNPPPPPFPPAQLFSGLTKHLLDIIHVRTAFESCPQTFVASRAPGQAQKQTAPPLAPPGQTQGSRPLSIELGAELLSCRNRLSSMQLRLSLSQKTLRRAG